MTKQKVFDWLRRGAIVVLFVTALLLLRHTGYYAGFRDMLLGSVDSGETGQVIESETAHAAVNIQPLAVTVCGPDGGARYGAAYDGNTAAVLRRFSVELGEALGSASDPVEIDEETFRDCLAGCGVSFRFLCPLQLRLLSGWLGTEMSGAAADDSAAFLCLAASETAISLCYRTTEGRCFRCATAAKPDVLRSRTTEYPPNGALFAWETDRVADGDFLLPPDSPDHSLVTPTVTLPQGADRDALLRAMGMNSFVASSYSESDGTVVYVNDETSLRINPSGTVFFRRAASPSVQDADDLAAAADGAWRVAERSIALYCGDAAVSFAGASYNESQRTVTVLLDYTVDGVPVSMASGHAAEIVFRGDALIQARLQFRSFALTEEKTTLLPYLQAVAIAAARDAEPALVYEDAGDSMECIWVIADG